MSRSGRLLVVAILLALALPAQARTPAAQRASAAQLASADPALEGILQLGLELDPEQPDPAAALSPSQATPLAGTTGDAYEPDDSIAQAVTLTLGTIYPGHNFGSEGDSDYSVFKAVAGKSYAIELLNLGCQCDPGLVLYGPSGPPSWIYAESSRRFILWTAPAGGFYFVRVYSNDSGNYGPRTTYALRVRAFPNPPDAYEPDDDESTSRPIALGTSYRHTFHTAADQDASKVKVVAGRYYMADALNLGTMSRPVLELFSDDGHGTVDSVLEGGRHITWQAAYTGVYHVLARNDGGFSKGDLFGPETHYDLRVRSFVPAKDAYEGDNGYTVATTATVGVRYRHNASSPDDTDWSAFDAVAGTRYRIEASPVGRYAAGAWWLYLVGTDGSTPLSSTGGTALGWTAPADGRYLVRMVHNPAAPCGPGSEYDLEVQGPDPAEPDSSLGEATPIAVGSTSPPHSIFSADDVDWFSFDVTPGKTYALDALVSGGPYPSLELLTWAGSPLASGGRHVLWHAGIADKLFVRVSAREHIHSYRLRVRAVSSYPDAFEPDNDSSHARPMAIGTTYKHNFHSSSDVDWMRFRATAGASYAIRGRALGLYCEPAYSFRSSAFGSVYPTQFAYDVDWGWTAPDSGTYYIQVANDNDSLYGAGSEYSLKISKYTPNPDAYEAGGGDNDHAHARTYAPLCSPEPHTFHVSYDQDWVSVSLQMSHNYQIETLSLGCGNDTVLQLFEPDGATLIASDDNSGPGAASRLVWTADITDTYHVVVTRKGGLAFGAGTEYNLRICDVTS